jgi:soluble lytic murein transglycosylase
MSASPSKGRVDDQWLAAQEFVREYRPLLRADSGRLSDSLALLVVTAADNNNVSRRLAFQLVLIESRFSVTALSSVGARGLTQVMPSTGRTVCGLTREQLHQAAPNLDCGFQYLRSLLDRYDNNEWFALTGYYRGPTRADQIKRLGLGYPESILEGQ